MASYIVDGLTVTPIHPNAFGAVVSGVDWSQSPLPDSIIETLVPLQDKYAIIVFRKTGLDNERHVRFACQLGELEKNPQWGGTTHVGTPYLFDVSKIEPDGSIVKKGTRRWAHALDNSLWHTDSSFNQHRSKYSMLLEHVIPGPGQASTHFADTRQAWKDLPEARKAELKDVIVEHELWYSRRLASPDIYHQPTEEERRIKPPSYHKLVQNAPNGETTFFLATHAKTLFNAEGEKLPECQKLIDELVQHCTQPKYTFTAEWHSPGDMIW